MPRRAWALCTPWITLLVCIAALLCFAPAAHAGDAALVSLSGAKFNDLNGNGLLDPGEPGLAGWTLYLDLNNNGQLDPGEPSVVSAAGGAFTFHAEVDHGAFALREVPQAGWTMTTAPIMVTIPPVTQSGLLLGNRQNATPPADVPESDTLWLFGAGSLALVAYLALRRRTAVPRA